MVIFYKIHIYLALCAFVTVPIQILSMHPDTAHKNFMSPKGMLCFTNNTLGEKERSSITTPPPAYYGDTHEEKEEAIPSMFTGLNTQKFIAPKPMRVPSLGDNHRHPIKELKDKTPQPSPESSEDFEEEEEIYKFTFTKKAIALSKHGLNPHHENNTKKIAHAMDLNQQLTNAICRGQLELVETLLKDETASPNLFLTANSSETVFTTAANLYQTAKTTAEKNIRLAIMDALLKCGADVNVKISNTQSTLLMFAARNNDIALAKLLIEHRINIYSTNIFDQTAYDIASNNNSNEVLIALGIALTSKKKFNTDDALKNHRNLMIVIPDDQAQTSLEFCNETF